MVLNRSKDSEYHTQRNNLLIPHQSCNTTSMVMALKQAGLIFDHPEKEQPEDYLTRFLRKKRSYKKMEQLAPWAFDSLGNAIYPPNEVHVMLEWAVNELIGKAVDRFSVSCSVSDMLRHLRDGGGVVLSGVFPIASGDLNHMVSLAGFVYEAEDLANLDLQKVSRFIIDDPYGDWHSGYTDHHGNNVELSYSQFNRIFKQIGRMKAKWAHLVG
jgi:hypothetical protein